MGWTAVVLKRRNRQAFLLFSWFNRGQVSCQEDKYTFSISGISSSTLFRDNESSPNLRRRQDEFWWFVRRIGERLNIYRRSSPWNECPVPSPQNDYEFPIDTVQFYCFFFIYRKDVTVYLRLALNSRWSSCLISHIFVITGLHHYLQLNRMCFWGSWASEKNGHSFNWSVSHLV